jgi:zinc transport system substrate-binding protein
MICIRGEIAMKKKSFLKFILISTLCSMVLAASSCKNSKSENENTGDKDKLKVAVSIVPEETFVKAVGGDLVDVVTLIPPGKSPENYAPTPEQMEKLSNAQLYFAIGVPTEEANILPTIKDMNNGMKLVKLQDAVAKVYPDRKFESGGRDPHIWLSPKRAVVMVETIKNELTSLDEKNKDIYEKNANEYIKQLTQVDNNIKESLAGLENKTIIVYHPAFGYFADDYGLKMIALEEEGKEATMQNLQKTIDEAKKQNIKVIFYQAEVDSRQSETFAEEIGGKAVQLDPLAANYIENLQKTADTFKNTLK